MRKPCFCRQKSSHKESASTAGDVEGLTDSLQTKVVIDHGEKESPQANPEQEAIPSQKSSEQEEAVAEKRPAVETSQEPASTGSWAKIAARPIDGAAKQAVET